MSASRRSRSRIVLLILSVCAGAAAAAPAAGPFRRIEDVGDGARIRWDPAGARAMWRKAGSHRVPFPLGSGGSLTLELERFRVIAPGGRFVLAGPGGADRELRYDADRILLLRGHAVGVEGSRVFLGLGPDRSAGLIDLGEEGGRYAVREGPEGTLRVRELSAIAGPGPGLPPDVPLCGVPPGGDPVVEAQETTVVRPYLKQLELAVDTDHEYYQLFGDATAAADYLVLLYAQVSDIYIRDVGTRVALSFTRIWDTPTDPFNSTSNPLSEFRSYWNLNMGAVQRDAAQLVSGRRDYPYGGAAYLSSLCSTSGYSVTGYILGFFDFASFNYDVGVTAHELGHNAGTAHTHDSPNLVDTCDDPLGVPQRGTIMSYCPQTWSGGRRLWDLYFHSRIQMNIENHISTRTCMVNDCNGNGVDDNVDLLSGSTDSNFNGVPDECEDCNSNLVLDSVDIALGTSLDLNTNGIPDECEPDCNGDSVPDDKNIADGTSLDLYGDDVPDECEEDCDGTGTSDYTEIQLDMTLDIDRDARIDDCQDCDADGTNDLDALAGGHNVWVASGLYGSTVGEFHGQSGVRNRTSSGALVLRGQDLIVTPDGRVLVSSADNDRVLAFDLTGSYLGDLVSTGAGGLDHPTGLLWAPDGRLLVASRNTSSVLAFDGVSGAPLGALVAAGSGGLTAPFGMTLGPDWDLYVASGANEVLEYDVQTGAFLGTFVSSGGNGGLDRPRGLAFKPDGNLLVASYGTNQVLEYHGITGAPLGPWAQVGTATVLTQVSPWGIRVGPNGNVFVGRTGDVYGSGVESGVVGNHLLNAQMYEFDVSNGLFLRSHISGNDHGLEFPTGFDFVPGWSLDCNLNFLPDSCDLASGGSTDCNGNAIPDDCEGPGAGCLPCTVDADCDDGVSCTVNDCNEAGGYCEFPVQAGSCRIGGVCYADGDLHPGDDCQDCDAAAPGSWSPSPAAEVAGLSVAAGSPTHLDWQDLGPAVVYDVATGGLATLRAEGGVVSAACAADDLSGTGWDDAAADPAVGDGSYYLLRAQKICSTGTWGAGTSVPRLPAAGCP